MGSRGTRLKLIQHLINDFEGLAFYGSRANAKLVSDIPGAHR